MWTGMRSQPSPATHSRRRETGRAQQLNLAATHSEHSPILNCYFLPVRSVKNLAIQPKSSSATPSILAFCSNILCYTESIAL
jgi:hypothetical protein